MRSVPLLLSTAPLLLAGLVGSSVMALLGPPLAMGLAIWTGRTTEPVLPALAYPWATQGALLLGWGAGLFLQIKATGPLQRYSGLLLPSSAVLAALLPWLHLYRLWLRT